MGLRIGKSSIKLTRLHCHGRTHVYALCRALVVDQLVCFSTEANRHEAVCAVRFAPAKGSWRATTVCEDGSTNVSGLANRFPGWRLLRS